jgi:hypothetical protein
MESTQEFLQELSKNGAEALKRSPVEITAQWSGERRGQTRLELVDVPDADAGFVRIVGIQGFCDDSLMTAADVYYQVYRRGELIFIVGHAYIGGDEILRLGSVPRLEDLWTFAPGELSELHIELFVPDNCSVESENVSGLKLQGAAYRTEA